MFLHACNKVICFTEAKVKGYLLSLLTKMILNLSILT